MSTSAKIILLLNILFLTVSCELQKTPLTSERVIVMAHSVGNKKGWKVQTPQPLKTRPNPLNVENPDELKDEEDEGKPKFAPAEKTDKKVKASPKMFASKGKKSATKAKKSATKGKKSATKAKKSATKAKKSATMGKKSGKNASSEMLASKGKKSATKAKKSGTKAKKSATKAKKSATKAKKSGEKPKSEMFASKGKLNGPKGKKSLEKPESKKWKDSIDEGESRTARKDEPKESKKPTRMFQD